MTKCDHKHSGRVTVRGGRAYSPARRGAVLVILLSGGRGASHERHHITEYIQKRMADETVLTPQVLAIIASLMSLLSLVVSSIHCVFACKKPDCNFRMRFGSQSNVADTTTPDANGTVTANGTASGTTMQS